MFTFFKLWINLIRNSVCTLKRQSMLKIFFVMFCSVIFLTVEFLVCYRVFSFLRDFQGVGSIIIERMLYLFYFALFLMLIFSNAIIAYAAIYRSKDMELLFTFPLDSSSIFRYKFMESSALSSWAFLVLLIPFMMSYAVAIHADKGLYLFLPMFFIPFLMIAALLGAGLTAFLLKIAPSKGTKKIIFLIALIAIGAIYIAARKIRFQESNQTIEIFILNQMLPNITLSHSPFLPSYWMSEGILKAARKEFKDALFYFLLLLSTTLFFTEALVYVAGGSYMKSWQDIRFRAREKLFILNRGIIERLRRVWRIFGTETCALITKDLKLFWRDPMQWSQFVIFFGILAIYFVNIRNFSYNMLQPFWKNICAFLNLNATLLTLGSLSTRFIFPQISLEGNKFWIIGLSPLGLKKVLYEKFWTNVIVSLVITETLMVISNRMLGISGMIDACFMWVVFVMNFSLVGLSLGLGAIFPNFKSENPANIVSGFGGTLTLILSICFILISGVLIMLPFQLFLKGRIHSHMELRKEVLFALLLITAIGTLLCVLPLMYGERKLRHIEIYN